jgi:hypothetical protein
MMRYVRFSDTSGLIPGGHQQSDYGPVAAPTAPGAKVELREDIALQLFHKERVQIDESKWLPFLRKDRWYDLLQARQNPVLGRYGRWSPDNTRVWEVLSISIELANRMFNALIDEKHTMSVMELVARMN